MKTTLTRKERRNEWKLSWMISKNDFEGENRKEKREKWYQSWSKFKIS